MPPQIPAWNATPYDYDSEPPYDLMHIDGLRQYVHHFGLTPVSHNKRVHLIDALHLHYRGPRVAAQPLVVQHCPATPPASIQRNCEPVPAVPRANDHRVLTHPPRDGDTKARPILLHDHESQNTPQSSQRRGQRPPEQSQDRGRRAPANAVANNAKRTRAKSQPSRECFYDVPEWPAADDLALTARVTIPAPDRWYDFPGWLVHWQDIDQQMRPYLRDKRGKAVYAGPASTSSGCADWYNWVLGGLVPAALVFIGLLIARDMISIIIK